MSSDASDRIAAARSLVAAPLLIAIADNLDARGEHTCARLARASIMGPWKHVGEIVASDDALNSYELHMRMSCVPRGYKVSTKVPPGYENAVRKQFAIFITAAHAFWNEFRTAIAALAAGTTSDARDARLLLAELSERLNASETAVWMRADDEYWAGIYVYFIDKNTREYIVM